MEADSLLEFLKSRRSIRRFENREVPEELLLKILETARWAPSSKNKQPWEFILVRNRDTLTKMSQLSPGAWPLRGASAAVVVVVDPETAPITYLIDGALVSLYIQLSAHALGLGTVWIEALKITAGLRELLKIPEKLVPVSVIAMGYPAESPQPRPRKPLSEILHREEYGRREVGL